MSGALAELALDFLSGHPGAAGAVLEQVDPEEAANALLPLDLRRASDVLMRMNVDAAARTLRCMDDTWARDTLLAADFVQAARWLAHLDDDTSARLLAALPAQSQRNIREALEFPQDTAGRLMDPRVTTFREETTVDEALIRIRKTRDRKITDVVLADDEGKLTGVVSLQRLIGAPDNAAMGSLADRDRPVVNPMATRDEVVDLLNRHALTSLPVVDLDGQVLGILPYDTLVRAAQYAATDDLQQMVGAGKDERALSKPLFTVKSRLPWLLINLVTGFLAATVVGLFDATIAKFTALAVLMPVVAGQAGNTGAQALAVTSRGLALREIRIGHWWRVCRKEALASFVNGSSVALITALCTFLWSGNPGLSLVIGVSMVCSMVIAAVSGCSVPIILTALKRDPATASSIILTTVTDVSGFFSFLGLATLLSKLLVAGH
ncbi:MAG TPA: magnesium transporter [Polyangiaceae bacterium]|nr:magnesium transporter [Polyangiaceae bacterium]